MMTVLPITIAMIAAVSFGISGVVKAWKHEDPEDSIDRMIGAIIVGLLYAIILPFSGS